MSQLPQPRPARASPLGQRRPKPDGAGSDHRVQAKDAEISGRWPGRSSTAQGHPSGLHLPYLSALSRQAPARYFPATKIAVQYFNGVGKTSDIFRHCSALILIKGAFP